MKISKELIAQWLKAAGIAIGLMLLMTGLSHAGISTDDMKDQLEAHIGSGSWGQYAIGGAGLVAGGFASHKNLALGIGIVVTVWGLIGLFNAGLFGS
ncbi:hypothetical protein L3V86_08415 [Thiotrichales bacterium 19S11-10]|nr:hypothetical protein [Thiotrichales bacterium 19S11-10]